MENYKITLHQIETEPRKILLSVSYMIKVPNFFTLLENDDNGIKIDSPSFEFANAKWQFHFNSKREYIKGRRFKMFNVSLEQPEGFYDCIVSYSILLLDADNKKHDHHCGKETFNEYVYERCMGSFRNNNPFFDKRETLTLIVHLICDEMPEAELIQVASLANKVVTETTEDYRISLCELPRKTLSSINYTITVPNFFNPPYINCKSTMSSQPFKFCNASWKFLFNPGGKSNGNSVFSLYLTRINSEVRKHFISYTFSVLDEFNQADESKFGIFLFKEDVNRVCTWTLSKGENYNRDQNTLTFTAHLICVEPPEEHVVKEPLKKQLQEDFERLFLNGKNHDLTLKVAEKEFQVHKDVLMARSPVFESMLSHDMTEKNKSFIDIPDCDPQVMEKFLFYVYCGKLDTLSIDDAIAMYYIADKYSMILLKKQCSRFIKKFLSPQMVCDVIKLSINHSDSDLLEYATEYFRNHMHDIFTTPKWMSFLTEDVTTANELLVKASKKWKNIYS